MTDTIKEDLLRGAKQISEYSGEPVIEEGEFVSALSKAWKKAQMGLGPWELLLG